tara:strand:+ start:37 stop:531 length:495 start_codon:yes stop_codon:yes gene_type:complete
LIDIKEIKNKIILKENFLLIIVIFTIFLLDRYSKSLVLEKFSENVFYVNEFLNFNLIWNTGIGFGLLSFNSSLFYNLISGIIGAVIIFLIIIGIKSDKFDKITFSIIIGGAFGNFYDRIVFKAVPDFIDLHYMDFHWFTFNVADIFITLGILSFILKSFFVRNN